VAEVDAQAAQLLLRYCVLSKPTHLLRTLPPSITEAFTARFDAAALECITSTLDLPTPLSAEALLDLSMPFRLGGLGYRPTSRVRHPAYWGAAASSLSAVLDQTGLVISDPLCDSLTVVREMRLTHAHLVGGRLLTPDGTAINVDCDASLTSFAGGTVVRGIQKVLTHLMENTLDLTRRYQADPEFIARTMACRARGASTWLTTIPSPDYPELTMSSREIRFAVRHRLGLPPSDAMPHRCACGLQLSGLSAIRQSSHFHECTFERPRAVSFRHDMVRDAAAAIIRESGTPITCEDHWRPNDWPDIEAFFSPSARVPRGHVLADVHVVCPSARSRVAVAQNPLACARAGEDLKVNRYRHLTMDENGVAVARSLPLAFESYGGAAPLTVTLLGLVVAAYAQQRNPSMTPGQFSVNLRQRLSVTLQRGNALISHLGLLHARGVRVTRPRRGSVD
jgi:hypothetical protein